MTLKITTARHITHIEDARNWLVFQNEPCPDSYFCTLQNFKVQEIDIEGLESHKVFKAIEWTNYDEGVGSSMVFKALPFCDYDKALRIFIDFFERKTVN
jgi:hypothetical protein